jgi:hypothetical protein
LNDFVRVPDGRKSTDCHRACPEHGEFHGPFTPLNSPHRRQFHLALPAHPDTPATGFRFVFQLPSPLDELFFVYS